LTKCPIKLNFLLLEKRTMAMTFTNTHAFIFMVFALAACTKPAPMTEAPKVDPDYQANFPGCKWGEVRSEGLSIWAFACEKSKLVADPTAPGFSLAWTNDQGKVENHSVIVVFKKPVEAGIEAVLPQVMTSSGAETDDTCAFEPVPNEKGLYSLKPTGKTKAAYAVLLETGETEAMPCGRWGPSESGERFFKILPEAQDKVIAIDMGSEIQPFDTKTLRVSAK
jgi:hypothetical protein